METLIANPFEQIVKQNNLILERLERLEKNTKPKAEQEYPKYFTVQQLHELTGMPYATIYTKSSKGQLPRTKIGKRLLFPSKEIIEFLEVNGKRPIIK